jgi:DNA-binding NarL/FixJ family response regulator
VSSPRPGGQDVQTKANPFPGEQECSRRHQQRRKAETTLAAEQTHTEPKSKTHIHPLITGADILVEAIREVGKGGTYLPPAMARRPLSTINC